MPVGGGDLGIEWVRWGRAALLGVHREGMGQAAVEMMLRPRHLLPRVSRAGQGQKGRLCGCGRAGAGAHTALPAAARVCPGSRGWGGQRGTAAPLCLSANKVPFLLLHSLQLPAQAIQEEPQEPVETQRQRRAQTHPLERGERPRGTRERDF